MADNPVLVDPAVSAAKLERELAAWKQNSDVYARRGWLLLGHDGLDAEVAFLGRLPLMGPALPVVPACMRVNFDNYDIWAPSVTFIDIFTRKPAAPLAQALTWDQGQEQNALVSGHPETGLPFLCIPGTREYHSHHEHSGDEWLLYRAQGRGSLAAICEEVWQRMVRTVVGYRCEAMGVPITDDAYHVNFNVALLQADVDTLHQQAMHQQALQAMQQQAQAQAVPEPPAGDATRPAP